jgi:hypothetical protein
MRSCLLLYLVVGVTLVERGSHRDNGGSELQRRTCRYVRAQLLLYAAAGAASCCCGLVAVASVARAVGECLLVSLDQAVCFVGEPFGPACVLFSSCAW